METFFNNFIFFLNTHPQQKGVLVFAQDMLVLTGFKIHI